MSKLRLFALVVDAEPQPFTFTSSPYTLCVCIPSRITTQSHFHRAWRERDHAATTYAAGMARVWASWRLAGISTCRVSPQASHRTTRQNIDAHTAIVSARDVTIFDPLPADFIPSELSLFHGSDRLTHWQSAMHKSHPRSYAHYCTRWSRRSPLHQEQHNVAK